MQTINPQYIIDKKGNRISVVISVNEFETIIEELEKLEDIRLYDEAKSVDEAFGKIENRSILRPKSNL
jgi:hypothetical protein